MTHIMMTDDEISEVARRVLQNDPTRLGFIGSKVVSDMDFDGTPVIRVTARYERMPRPPKPLDMMHAIRAELLSLGEPRSVFLTNEYGDEPSFIEDDAA